MNYSKIEDVRYPVIGEIYLVRCVLWQLYDEDFTEEGIWTPVFARKHIDKEYQQKPHYHLDNRFTEESFMLKRRTIMDNGGDYTATKCPGHGENHQAIIDREVLKEEYRPLIYKRHFNLMKDMGFDKIAKAMVGKIMKNMICPHHGANLKSCPVVNDVVTCPQHGIKWNTKTGVLV